MVFYTCEMCNFSSKYTTNYQKHLNSNKHLKKMGTIKVCNGKKIVPKGNTKLEVKKKCPKCDKVFTHSNSYYRHVKHYCQKKIENQNIIPSKYFDDYKEIVNKLLEEKDKRISEVSKYANKLQENVTGNTINNYNNTYNNTNYVLQFISYNNADSMNKIAPKFKLTKEEFIKAASSDGYQGALLEKADNIIIHPYNSIIDKRPIHTVDFARKKALYKDDLHDTWTSEPDITLNDCFEQFHQSAIEQRDKAVLENEGNLPESEEDLLYKQIFFIPTNNKDKELICNKVKEHIYRETKVNKKDNIK
jgi:uncharacterized C2H2 Zn-finger protein